MGRFTVLSLADAKRLGAEYGLEIERVEPLEAGSVNSNFRLVDRLGRVFFARIYEEQGIEGARAELALLGDLIGAGVPTAVPLDRTGDGGPAELEGKAFAIYRWVQGDLLCQGQVRPVHCERVGRAVGGLHAATSSVRRVPAGRFEVNDVLERLHAIEREHSHFANVAKELAIRLEELVLRRDRGLPSGVIHGDLFRDNVLWQDGEIAALIDFESASRGSFAYDLMVTIQAWCYGASFEEDLVRAMLSGYDAVRPLGAREIDALVVEGAIGALRFATTRITDFSLRAAPNTPPKRDFRRFIARLDALEAGALDAPIKSLRPASGRMKE